VIGQVSFFDFVRLVDFALILLFAMGEKRGAKPQ
jgi:hypothetical protein